MARVLVVDADSKAGFPNLALMKISAWHKQQGDSVDLIMGIPYAQPLIPYDKTYISVIYWQNAIKANTYARMLPGEVDIGGIGDSYKKLSDEIEHIRPDYALYPTKFSMGFTSRGCIRKCKWCVVPKKEGDIHDHAPITEFLHPKHKKLVLLDNNFLASPMWEKNLQFIIAKKLKVNFNQGLDIRTVTTEKAEMLRDTKIQDWHFKKRKFTFAFDHPSHKRGVIKGIRILRDAGINLSSNNCVFYVLVGFNTTPAQDLERIDILRKLDVGPFVMRFNKEKGEHRILLHMSRWVNRKLFQFMEFCDYDYSDSKKAYRAVFGGVTK